MQARILGTPIESVIGIRREVIFLVTLQEITLEKYVQNPGRIVAIRKLSKTGFGEISG